LAIRNGLAFTRVTGGSVLAMLINGWKMKQSNGMTFAQTLMAANAPMLIQQAMVNGHPDQGILPSGQIAGVITDLPSCAQLINAIVAEALATLAQLSARGPQSTTFESPGAVH